jgi:cell division protein ZapE
MHGSRRAGGNSAATPRIATAASSSKAAGWRCARAAADYIEIAREFHTVLLGGIPAMDARRDDAARRFVTLVDELYDRHVNLVCAAAAPPPGLYAGERLAAAFERTASRLVEMQSAAYLALEHRG